MKVYPKQWGHSPGFRKQLPSLWSGCLVRKRKRKPVCLLRWPIGNWGFLIKSWTQDPRRRIRTRLTSRFANCRRSHLHWCQTVATLASCNTQHKVSSFHHFVSTSRISHIKRYSALTFPRIMMPIKKKYLKPKLLTFKKLEFSMFKLK